MSLLPGLLVILGNEWGMGYTWLNVLFSLGFLAVLERVLGDNSQDNHSEFRDAFPKLLLYAHVVLTIAMMGSLFGLAMGKNTGALEWLGAVLSTGLACGSGAVVVAHELIHKAQLLPRLAGRFLLLLVGNPYFSAHHILVHHVHVGTANDCVTARKGESLYAYIPRSILGQFKEARLAEKRLETTINGPLGLFKSHLLQNVFIGMLTALTLGLISPLLLFSWIAVSALSALLLEYVNYIEHYGLSRSPGERVGPAHSWNSNRSISRFLLFDLSRHADHHMHASKPYHCLDSGLSSPQLPGGYIQLLFLAIWPSRWFRVVDALLP